MPQPRAERVAVSGIGGIGGVIAGAMLNAGLTPVLITGNKSITEAIQQDGLHVRMPGRSFTVRAEVYTSVSDAAGGGLFDAAYLCMKANSVVDAAAETARFLSPAGYVVTYQNGIVEDAVGQAIGIERVLSGIIAWGGTMHAPGQYERTTPGKTFIGELDGRITPRVNTVAAAVAHAGPVSISQNMRGVLWSKLAINCTINSVGAIAGGTLGELLADRRVRQIFLRTYSEVVDTAEAQGVRLEPIAANPKLLYVPPGAGRVTLFSKDLLARMLGRKYRHARSSTLQSLERGRKTEVNFLNGYVVAAARKIGVSAPMNEALTRMIREIEGGKRGIGRHNIDELAHAL